jgi:organic radical activating enzyme
MLFDKVKILKSTPYFYVYWMLGDTCQYKCSYCYPNLYAGKNQFHPLDVILKTYKKFVNPTLIMFSGGEPSLHPNFEQIIKEAPSNIKIGVITNLAKPIQFWEKVSKHISVPILTYHIEYAKFDRFVDSARVVFELCDKDHSLANFIRINLPMYPSKWNECKEIYFKLLDQGLPVLPKPLIELGPDVQKCIQIINPLYTDDQLAWINECNLKHDNKPINLYDEHNKLLYSTNSNELLSLGNTNFKGWTCYAGTESIRIQLGGDVITTICKQGKIIGNIFDDFTFCEKPVICNQNFCWGGCDIPRSKYRL